MKALKAVPIATLVVFDAPLTIIDHRKECVAVDLLLDDRPFDRVGAGEGQRVDLSSTDHEDLFRTG